MEKTELFSKIVSEVLSMGAFKANIIESSEVTVDPAFRDACARNACGMYGKCYTCPPDVGELDDLKKKLFSHKYVLVYQTVGNLEDSFDFEGMQECAEKHTELVKKVRKYFSTLNIEKTLHLGAGGCRMCPKCAKLTNEPCRFPDLALSSLEAYGIYVSDLAKKASMNYINGKDTVTYFGSVFFDI